VFGWLLPLLLLLVCLQCFTPDATSVAVIPDSAAPNNTVLRLQAVYYPTEITCMPNEAPFNSTKTSWTSGGLSSKSKRIFKAPMVLARGDASTGVLLLLMLLKGTSAVSV
jgi:hypothetical protein